jgi:hypothetical protein
MLAIPHTVGPQSGERVLLFVQTSIPNSFVGRGPASTARAKKAASVEQIAVALHLSHFPLIAHQAHTNAASRGIVVWFVIDAHADVGIDVSHQIVAMLHEAFDDRGAIDLMDLVMDMSRSRRPVGAQTVGIAFGVIRHD